MDAKDIRNLQEAYLEVYQEQELDEGLGSAVKRLLGGNKKEAEAPKPMSRGEVLRQRYNVGPERSDTSAKRQILDRSRARAQRDQADYGGSVYSRRVAQDSADAHERYLKAGYSKYGADLKHGSGNKARRRAATLNREQVDIILSHLLDEGYATSVEAAEAIMVNMSEDWRESICEAEKPFPYEKVKAKQVALRDKGGNALERRMKMGLAVRRAKEEEKTGGSQQTAGAGWYHGK